jgi:hypothetical protein
LAFAIRQHLATGTDQHYRGTDSAKTSHFESLSNKENGPDATRQRRPFCAKAPARLKQLKVGRGTD